MRVLEQQMPDASKSAKHGGKRTTAPLCCGSPSRVTIPQPGSHSDGIAHLGRWARNVKNGIAFATAVSSAVSTNTSTSATASVRNASTAGDTVPVRPHTSAAVLCDTTPTPPPTALDNHYHELGYVGMLSSWQHYSALSTIGDKPASIFIFERKWNVKTSMRLAGMIKLTLFDLLRYEISQLAQLTHPRILRMLQSCETKNTLAFACEPISMTMEYLFQQQEMHEIEMKICIIQLSDGLSYLHNSAKILHGNLTPASIFVTTNNHWKIGNFAFSVNAKKDENNTFPCYPWSKRLHPSLQPELDFVAPEYLVAGSVTSVTTAADVFSFGVLICWILSGGKRIIDAKSNLESYQIVVNQLDCALDVIEDQLGDSLKQILGKALSKEPSERPTPRQITMNKSFDEPTLNALRSLDDLGQVFDPANKAVFLSHTLLAAIPSVPEPLWFTRILMRFDELLVDAVELYPVILKPLVYMLNNCESHNIHRLTGWFRRILDNAQEKALSQAVVDNMPLIFRRLDDEQVEDRCFDLLIFILSSSDPHLKQTVLRAVPQMADYLPLKFVGQRLVPMFASMARYFEPQVGRQIDLLVSIVHLSDRCDANLLRSLLSISSMCNAIHPAVIHLKSRLVQRIVTCDVSRLNDPLVVAHHLLNPLVLGLALPEMSASHFEEVMSSSRVLLEIIEQLRYQAGNFLNNAENGRRLCNRRVSMSSNHLPRLLVTAARPSFGDGRKMSFLSADGRLEDRGSRRESKDSRCSFESDVSLRIGNGSDLSDESAMQMARSGSGQRGRRKSWLEGYMHSVSLEQSSQMNSSVVERRSSAVERAWTPLRHSVMSDRCFHGNSSADASMPPPLSHSVCGYMAADPILSLNDMSTTTTTHTTPNSQKQTTKPTTFTNLGHNLV